MIGLVLAAAGAGSRFGSDIPKQFIPLNGKPLYSHSLETLAQHCSECVLVLPPEWLYGVKAQVESLPCKEKLLLETGGEHRQDSVYRGLQRLSNHIKIVLVHDAVRPYVSSQLILRVIDGAREHRACIPALPVRETIKEVHEDRVVRTIQREDLQLVQTPQAFEIDLFKRAFEQARRDGFYGTDEAMLVERLGSPVYVVAGEAKNVKITWKEDLS